MLRHLTEERDYTIQKIENGIYYLLGDSIPIQFIVTSKLSFKENLWLKGLTNHLKNIELTEALAEDYRKHKTNTLLELGRSEDALKATTDSEYQEQLFKEFGL